MERKARGATPVCKLVLVCLLTALFTVLASCGGDAERAAAAMTGGTPAKGRAAIGRYGCSACHTVPGVSGANGHVGPPLAEIASRVYLAGRLQNTPDNMILWIRNPQGVDDKTAMPNLGVSEADARDIASYLYTLK
ncbi:MAG TPA: c-type cytochrome [Pyrinomonadaceae bacterium]|nr:c-type cytochrome [Pyrinomonadaceae bacterium]